MDATLHEEHTTMWHDSDGFLPPDGEHVRKGGATAVASGCTRLRYHTARVVCLVGYALLASACALPVTVKRGDPEAVQRQLTGYVLTNGQLSLAAENILRRHLLTQRFQDAPEQALAELHAAAVRDDNPDALFALAELSFYHAKESAKRSYYLAAAVYAFAFLFPG